LRGLGKLCASRIYPNSDIPPAKTQSSKENNNHRQTNSIPLIRPLRLGIFAGDLLISFLRFLRSLRLIIRFETFLDAALPRQGFREKSSFSDSAVPDLKRRSEESNP
jgi:hypothetical protein